MKIRTYIVNEFKGAKCFCPNCHRIVENNFLSSGNIKAINGLDINCGYCSNGKVKIMPSKALIAQWELLDKK